MTTINVYLVFDGNCREAMTFYKECLGGDLVLQYVEDSPMADQWPPDFQQRILHASLINQSTVLFASDMTSPEGTTEGNTVLLSLNCSSASELDAFYEKLAVGGIRLREPHDFFAGRIAMLKDKFNKTWMFYAGTSQNVEFSNT